jgi:cation:H+ antiporter
MMYGLGVLGLVLLVAGGYVLVKGSSSLALRIGMSTLVVGLTVVAFGTSAPEQAVTMMSSFQGEPQVALGNVVGSNVANVLLIVGLCALAVTLSVDWKLIYIHVPIMFAFSLAMLLMSLDGHLGRTDGLILFGALVIYVALSVFGTMRGNKTGKSSKSEDAEKPTGTLGKDVLFILAGLVLLTVGSHLIVKSACYIAEISGVSERVIALTVVAFGTSLPEIIVSLIGCFTGERDLIIGNVVGSNIFNIGSVLGLTLSIGPEGFDVVDQSLTRDMPMVLGTALMLFVMMITHRLVQRWEGFLLLGWYFMLMTLAVLQAKETTTASGFTTFLLVMALPATLILVAFSVVAHIRWVKKTNGTAKVT